MAKRLASLTGESLTKAVKRAIEQDWRRWKRRALQSDELDHIALHCANLPRLDRRSAGQIIGYDERGLPA